MNTLQFAFLFSFFQTFGAFAVFVYYDKAAADSLVMFFGAHTDTAPCSLEYVHTQW